MGESKNKIRTFDVFWKCRNLHAFWENQMNPKFVVGGPIPISRTGAQSFHNYTIAPKETDPNQPAWAECDSLGLVQCPIFTCISNQNSSIRIVVALQASPWAASYLERKLSWEDSWQRDHRSEQKKLISKGSDWMSAFGIAAVVNIFWCGPVVESGAKVTRYWLAIVRPVEEVVNLELM